MIKDRQKLELDQITALSDLYHQKCLRPTDGNGRDPVAVYNLFARKRPEEMNQDDSPSYLAT